MGELHLGECLIYLDSIMIFSSTIDEHFDYLNAVFKCIQEEV